MSKGKPRHDPDKRANRMNPHCPYYEVIDGKAHCHFYDPKELKCQGNAHNCVKVQYHKQASI